jgi:hypothetical protein
MGPGLRPGEAGAGNRGSLTADRFANPLRTAVAVVWDQAMMTTGRPQVDELSEVLAALREWQSEGGPMQLHPGDLGWFWRFGAEATAAAVRTWRGDGRLLAVGLLDGPGVLRMTIAPDVRRDEELAQQIVADLTGDEMLPEGEAAVEAPMDALIQELLAERGWSPAEPWTPLRRDLTEPVKDAGARIAVVGPEQAPTRATVQRASFDGSTFSAARWHAMAAGPAYADARCLLAYDDRDKAVAVVTVWSAGPADRDCSSRWASARTIAAGGTERRSASPRPPPCENWARPARSCAPRVPMPPPWPRTRRPVSSRSRRSGICAGTAESLSRSGSDSPVCGGTARAEGAPERSAGVR